MIAQKSNARSDSDLGTIIFSSEEAAGGADTAAAAVPANSLNYALLPNRDRDV